MIATLLSPGLRDVLNDAQKKAAKQYILKLKIQDPIITDDENKTQDESRGDEGSIDEPNEASPPSSKRFKHLSALLAAKQKGKDQQNEGMSSFEMELDCYITTPLAQSMEDDPFEFLLTVFPNFSNINLDLLGVSASSTAIERVYSVGGELTTGK